MQNAKDTFYEVLRTRLTALNPERTAVVRGVTRPGVLVVENELVSALPPADCFLLHWTGAQSDARGAMPLRTMNCEITYRTAGATGNGGMDRGRALATMDAELLAMLSQEPRNAVKTEYSGNTPTALATRVWWGDASVGEAKVVGERLQRSVTAAVMSYEEAGDA